MIVPYTVVLWQYQGPIYGRVWRCTAGNLWSSLHWAALWRCRSSGSVGVAAPRPGARGTPSALWRPCNAASTSSPARPWWGLLRWWCTHQTCASPSSLHCQEHLGPKRALPSDIHWHTEPPRALPRQGSPQVTLSVQAVSAMGRPALLPLQQQHRESVLHRGPALQTNVQKRVAATVRAGQAGGATQARQPAPTPARAQQLSAQGQHPTAQGTSVGKEQAQAVGPSPGSSLRCCRAVSPGGRCGAPAGASWAQPGCTGGAPRRRRRKVLRGPQLLAPLSLGKIGIPLRGLWNLLGRMLMPWGGPGIRQRGLGNPLARPGIRQRTRGKGKGSKGGEEASTTAVMSRRVRRRCTCTPTGWSWWRLGTAAAYHPSRGGELLGLLRRLHLDACCRQMVCDCCYGWGIQGLGFRVHGFGFRV